ncbi:MAG: flagellar M-ring protein FliF [Rhodobacteraceae bacterium]|nr:MAG: flagellar M-ring protein FliF [Paracoccaceae bacterium]
MQPIKYLWSSLDTRKQIMVVAAIMAILVSVLTLSKMASSPNLTLLYAGLEGRTAGETVRALEGMNVPYEVRGGSIFVPANRRDELRMTLAAEGLPANGSRGYELLDSLSGFGTTSQMFDAAYWRAKEGELARTIVTSSFVSQARVHIANRDSNPFRQTVDATASVSLVPSGAPITPAQANALRYLIASAVSGMSVENVAVIDANGTLIGAPESAAGPGTADDRAQVLRERIMRLVEARVGKGNAIVEVSVETVTETESIRERRFDPNGRIAISTDIEERIDSSKNQSGDVSVASNIPDGDAATGKGTQANNNSTRERINYEVSQTELEILRVPGAIKRLSVAVLVNGLNTAESDVFEPRPDEELTTLTDLVKSAVGFDTERGDTITLKSMDLPPIEPLGSVATTSFLQNLQLDFMSLIQIAALTLVTLVLGLFVVRPVLANSKTLALPNPPPLSLAVAGSPSGTAPGPIHEGEIDPAQDAHFQPTSNLPPTGQALPGTAVAALGSATENPVDRLRALIGERQEETVEILRSWLEESEEKT